jgi:eukaryotic-like serine/threonine-protein kinase
MTAERWQRIKDVLEAVEPLSGRDRDTELDRLCTGDPELRHEIDSLLAHEDRIGVFDDSAWEPRQIGPYRIERLLGAGGMGAVYLASRADDQYHKRVAIKVIQAFGGPGLIRRFRSERQILATLEHPGIARLLDGGALPDGRPYLVMEYVDGPRIDRYVAEHHLTPAGILRLFLRVCAAVQFAHQNLIVHRDLKAGNILVTREGAPRLLDFGIAKILAGAAEDEDQTRTLQRMLTPSAASPEQLAGASVTTASDVYSLGVLLQRLLPEAARATGDVSTILRKSTEKEPDRRYRTVDEFAADIQRYLDGRPIAARPASFAYRARKFVARNRYAVAAAALLGLAIAAGVTGTLWYARRAQAEKARADRRFDALRKISESFLFEFHDSIRDLPGSAAARVLVVRRALEYLDQLAAENAGDLAVQRDLAAAYLRIGGILSGQRSAHIGGADSLQKATEVQQKALAIRRRIFAANPSGQASRMALLESLWAVAEMTRIHGDLDGSLAIQQERLHLVQEVPAGRRPVDLQYSIGSTYTSMSELYRVKGDLDRSLDYARQALAVRQALLDANPQAARAHRVVAISHEFVGYSLDVKKQYAEAAGEHAAAVAQLEPLVAHDPSNVDLQRTLGVAEASLCETQARAGDAAAGLPHCRKAVSITEAMYRADRGNTEAGVDLASALGSLGLVLRLSGQPRQALEPLQRADKLYQAGMANDPDQPDVLTGYSDVLIELGRIHRSCTYADQALALLRRLPPAANVQSRIADASALCNR